MASTYHADIQALYVAYFNRPADYLGLEFWEEAIENAVAAAGDDAAAQAAAKAEVLGQISAGFAASAEYTDVYGGLATEQVIGAVYQNLFGHAPDLAGLKFWVDAVRGGHMTVANAVTTIAAGAQGTDLETFENKVAAAVAFTNEFDTGEEVLAYNGDEALTAAKAFIAGITTDASLAAAITPEAIKKAVAEVVDAGTPDPEVVQHVLTAGIDTIAGSANNDVINGVVDPAGTDSTFTVLDTIDGAAGEDTLVINMLGDASIDGTVSVTNVENAVVRSAGDATVDASTWTGLETVTVTQADIVDVTAGDSTAVVVGGAKEGITVTGGSDVTVTDATANFDITVDGAAGVVKVTDTKQGTGIVSIDGGTDVNVAVTAANVASGAVTVGATTAATGNVAVTQNLNSDGVAAMTGGNVTVTGGSTVDITVNATSTAKVTTAAAALTIGTIDVTGDGTTSVTIDQNATANKFTKAAVAAVKETTVVTFKAMTTGQTLTLNGLTFTASADLTAAQVAAAFANLTAADTQSTTGPVANGYYTGTFNTASWTSGAASGATVTFTAKDDDETDLVMTDGTATDPTQVKTTGTPSSGKVVSTNSVAYGAVVVGEGATAAITNVTLDGYASADLGVTGADLNKLTTLSLANSAGDATVATSATTLALSLDNVADAVIVGGTTMTKLNVTAAGEDSTVALTAAGVKDLTVAGSAALDLTGSTLTALETVVVSGSASLDLGTVVASKSINTTATTGSVTAQISADTATYTGGAGSDDVTLTAAAISKAVDLGAGDDMLTLMAGTTTIPTVEVKGGAGTDILSMSVASAVSFGGAGLFAPKVTGFEQLMLNDAAGDAALTTETVTVNMENLGYNYVITSGTAAGATPSGDILVLDKFAANGTVELSAFGDVRVALKDATGTADVVNVVTAVEAADADFGTFTAAGVETVNINASDIDDETIETSTLKLVATSATKVNVGGSANVALDLTGNTKVTLIDGSSMTGNLTVSSVNGDAAVTINGGAGDDTLTSLSTSTKADKLNGGAGDDTLVANKGMSVLTGGAGDDVFQISVASLNVNSAATITDLSAGDVIKFAGATSFNEAAISLDSTAVFQDFANAAIASVEADMGMSWFQFGGNTYIVMEADNDLESDVFVNGQDFIVKITGTVDLSTASYNATHNILEIGGPGA